MTIRAQPDFRLDLVSLSELYRSGAAKPTEVVRLTYRRIAADASNPIWISLRPQDEVLEDARRLELDHRRIDAASIPLYGVPFAIKDNIDVRGLPTTAGCRGRTCAAEEDAPAVARMRAAGAIPIGKTNLDQFATGLTGTRSNLGICRNAIDGNYIAGGSSSGSAVAVAAGHVGFALGTDTAGSGRVPAAFNNLVGFKPTRGLISARGMLAACRTLDCVSLFTVTARDARVLMNIAAAYDECDPFSRRSRVQHRPAAADLRVGVLAAPQAEFFGDREAEELYGRALDRWRGLGARIVEIDYSAFREAGELLYQGPWLAERHAAIVKLLGAGLEGQDIHPVTRLAIERATDYSAADVFEAYYRLRTLARRTQREWNRIDVMALPTAAPIYTVKEVLSDPLETNRRLGLYTNFTNLLDLCAIAIPAARRENGLPFGISLIAPPLHDEWLCTLGASYAAALS